MTQEELVIAERNVVELQEIFPKSFAIYGTALGSLRDNNIIPHDIDTDLGIFSSDFGWGGVNEAVRCGYEIQSIYGLRHHGMEISFIKDGVKTDLMLMYNDPNRVGKVFNCLWKNSGRRGMDDEIVHEYDRDMFEVKEGILGSSTIRTLGEKYVQHVYGDEWVLPIQEWNWEKDHKCHREPSQADVTAIIISFLRKDFTLECIRSLHRTYPSINIIVGENGNRDEDIAYECEQIGAKYIELPYDSGVCYARNRLVEQVSTKYVLIGDDDFSYDVGAKVDEMRVFLDANKGFDLIGGRIKEGDTIRNYQGLIRKEDDHFHAFPIDPDSQECKHDNLSGLRYFPADLTFNFFVARTAKVRQVPWDEKIKVAYEHFSWFYDFKCFGGKAAFSPDPIVIHKPKDIDDAFRMTSAYQDYLVYRNRKDDCQRFFSKYNIKYIIGMRNERTDAPK